MGVPQFTTPTFTLTFTEQGLDLTQAQKLFVTIQQGLHKLTKSMEDLDVGEKTIGVYLSQEETGSFTIGKVKFQANWLTNSNKRIASEIITYDITEQLLKDVIE